MAEAPVAERKGFAWSRPESATAEKAEYRTFPRNIAPTLVASGGALALIGALGAWIRAVQVTSESSGIEPIGTLWGFSEPTGRAIAILAAVTVLVAGATYFTKHLPAFSLEGSSLVLVAVVVVRLISLNSRSSELAAAARQDPNFVSYNAGFGWGAWCLLLGVALVFLGLLVGVLREVDLKRGLPE